MKNLEKRNDVRELVQKIESLAKEIQLKLTGDNDILTLSNELVRKNATFVFSLGELYALEQLKTHAPSSNDTASSFKPTGKTKITVVSPSSLIDKKNYYNIRDSYGRFSIKV